MSSSLDFIIFIILIVLIFCSMFIISSSHGLYSLFTLIFMYILTAVLFTILSVDYLAVLIIIIYSGAVGVLFLFFLMMLNLNDSSLVNKWYQYFPIGSLFIVVGLSAIYYINFFDTTFIYFSLILENYYDPNKYFAWVYDRGLLFKLGIMLFTRYGHWVVLVSLILLVSAIGCISTTIDFMYRTKRSHSSNCVVSRKDISIWI